MSSVWPATWEWAWIPGYIETPHGYWSWPEILGWGQDSARWTARYFRASEPIVLPSQNAGPLQTCTVVSANPGPRDLTTPPWPSPSMLHIIPRMILSKHTDQLFLSEFLPLSFSLTHMHMHAHNPTFAYLKWCPITLKIKTKVLNRARNIPTVRPLVLSKLILHFSGNTVNFLSILPTHPASSCHRALAHAWKALFSGVSSFCFQLKHPAF